MARYKNIEIDKALNKGIAQRIKSVRLENNLTQTEFGEKLKITRPSVYRLENGMNYPSSQTIELICNKFGINETWLRFGEQHSKSKKDEFDMMFSSLSETECKFVEEILTIYQSLDNEGQTCLRKLAESLAKRKD